MGRSLFNVWRPVHTTHAAAGDGKTLCGVELHGLWEEGTFFDDNEAETYVTCRRCLKAIDATTADQAGDGNG